MEEAEDFYTKLEKDVNEAIAAQEEKSDAQLLLPWYVHNTLALTMAVPILKDGFYLYLEWFSTNKFGRQYNCKMVEPYSVYCGGPCIKRNIELCKETPFWGIYVIRRRCGCHLYLDMMVGEVFYTHYEWTDPPMDALKNILDWIELNPHLGSVEERSKGPMLNEKKFITINIL